MVKPSEAYGQHSLVRRHTVVRVTHKTLFCNNRYTILGLPKNTYILITGCSAQGILLESH